MRANQPKRNMKQVLPVLLCLIAARAHAGPYGTLDCMLFTVKTNFPCSDATCAPGQRINFSGTSPTFGASAGWSFNRYLSTELALDLGTNTDNSGSNSTFQDQDESLTGLNLVRASLRAGVPLAHWLRPFVAAGPAWMNLNFTNDRWPKPGPSLSMTTVFLETGVEVKVAWWLVRLSYYPTRKGTQFTIDGWSLVLTVPTW